MTYQVEAFSAKALLHETITLLTDYGNSVSTSMPNGQSGTIRGKELTNVTLRLFNWRDRDEAVQEHFKPFEERALAFLEQEWKEWWANPRVNPGEAYKLAHNATTWEKALRPDGTFFYTYGERLWFPYHQAKLLFKWNPQTRQAFVGVWAPQDIQEAGNERIPCTIGYHFQMDRPSLIKPALNMTMVMRSTDAMNCLANDVWLGTHLLEKMAGDLEVSPGVFTLFTTNLHLFF